MTPDLSGRTILQIIPELDAGGAERTAVDVAAALARAGARPLVLARGGRLVPELQEAGAEFIPFPAHSKNPIRMLISAFRLASLIRRERVDLVHARSRAPAWVALWAGRLTKTPFVTTWHGSYRARGRFKRLYNSIMARGQGVIANSSWTAREIIQRYPWAKDRISVIPRGTDLTRFDPDAIDPARIEALRAGWHIPQNVRLVLVAARMTTWKGHMVLLQALHQLYPMVHAVFAGDAQGRDTYVASLREEAARLGLASRVHIVGHTTDVPAALMLADVVAVPSTAPEAFGRVAVEAQALGLPVVVSDHGAVPETVLAPPEVRAEQRTGWRVTPNDAEALADALNDALNLNASGRAKLAERARAHAATLGLECMTDATLQFYARQLGIDGEERLTS